MPVERRGLGSRTTLTRRGRGEWHEPGASRKSPEAASGVARQSEGIAELPLLPALRQAVPERHPGLAPPTAERRGWTARGSRTSSRKAGKHGWANWRESSERRGIDRRRFAGSTSRSRAEVSGR